jgi:prepilin-type N-terminal cleavage/methylation domain-containing protein
MRNRSRGFTLTEVMVSLVVLVLVGAGATGCVLLMRVLYRLGSP